MTEVIDNWYDLYEKCPINLEIIKDDALEVEDKMDKIKNGKYNMNDVNRAKFLTTKIMGIMMNSLHFKDFVKDKDDFERFRDIADNMGRIFKLLEHWESETILVGSRDYQVLSYISRIEEMLYSVIYVPLKIATDLEPNDKSKFLEVLKTKIEIATAVFGAHTRDKRSGTGKAQILSYPTHSNPSSEIREGKSSDDEIAKLKEMESK